MWKTFFYFTKDEKRSMLLLLAIILCASVLYAILDHTSRNASRCEIDSISLHGEYMDFIASLDAIRDKQRIHYAAKDKKERNVILSAFDPNTADSITFCKLGLPPWMAGNILRYREKGGVFRKAADFRKVYGMSDGLFATLQPYITIGSQFTVQQVKRAYVTDTVEQPTEVILIPKQFKYPAGTIIDLNQSDTTELKKIPGIGSGYAKRIVAYRKRLGGFHCIAQLKDIGLNTDTLSKWFAVTEGEVTPINLNRASAERIKAHPYFDFYQAKAIVEHRRKKGAWKRIDQLGFYEEFTPEDLERIRPYVCFE